MRLHLKYFDKFIYAFIKFLNLGISHGKSLFKLGDDWKLNRSLDWNLPPCYMKSYITLTPQTRAKAVQLVTQAPDGYIFTLPKEPIRSLDQNALMWALLNDLAEQVDWTINGELQKLSPDDWKDLITAGLYQEKRIAVGLRGGLVTLGKSTRRMTTAQMNELIEFIYAFGTEKEVDWSMPADEISHWFKTSVYAKKYPAAVSTGQGKFEQKG